MTSPDGRVNRLLYVADPMCSWCWGFSPVMQSITEHFGTRMPVTVMVGGLAPGTTAPMDLGAKSRVREHWDHVREATGQPFEYGFFDRQGFVYDTEPPCRAVVAMRQLQPHQALPFLAYLHGGFYRDNQDITNTATLCDLAAAYGLDRATFAEVLEHEATRLATQQDFALARKLGISGFPCLIGQDGEHLTPITVGYRPWKLIRRTIDAWLEGEITN